MITTFSYEIGAIFLLAAMLMYGTMSGFIPRAFQAGKPALVVLAVVLIGFALYELGPDLSSGWHSIFANSPGSAAMATAPAPRPATPAHKAVKPIPRSRITFIETPDAQPDPVPQKPVVPAREQTNAAPAPTPEQTYTAPDSPDNSQDDPYDSGIKRAAKRVGRFLHIGRKKTSQ